MKQQYLTVTGKIATISAGFRLAIPDYQRALELAARRGKTLSALTAELWQRELAREGGKDASAKL